MKILGVVVTLALSGVGQAGASPHLTLNDVILNVEANEQLYNNLDATLREREEWVGPPMQVDDPKIKAVRALDTAVHYVGQDGMFRVEANMDIRCAEGEKRTNATVRVFDKQQTRSLLSSAVTVPGNVNLIAGRVDDARIVRPHMLLMRIKGYVTPFSAHLRGVDAIRAYPTGEFSNSTDLSTEYLGEEDYKSLHCHKVKHIHIVKATGKPKFHTVLWLAEDRNYIPCRREAYDYEYSKDVPISEGEATDWREIKPGIWLPFVTKVVRYDSTEVKRNRRKQLKGSWTYQFERASLDPKYELAYFQELKIPDGSAVYEVQDKKIIRSYRQGQPDVNPQKSSSWPLRWLLLWGNIAVVVVSGVFVVRKRLRRTAHIA